MKKIRKAVAIFATVALVCGSVFAASKGKKPKMKVNRPVTIDYQGASLGKEIPAWVEAVVDGNNEEVVKTLNLKDQKIFVVSSKGPKLDFLKSWTDLVDARSEVSSSIEQTVASVVQSSSKMSEEETAKTLSTYNSAVSHLTLNGLEKRSSYWILQQSVKPGVKKAKTEDDYIVEYTYYVVFAMDEKIYNDQVKAALDDIEANTSETEELKKAVTAALTASIVMGESKEVK